MADAEEGIGLKTRHVFLDTEAYRRYGHNLSDKVLLTLLRLINDHICSLHITDITESEIARQIKEAAIELADSANKANRRLHSWRLSRSWAPATHKAPDHIDGAAIAAEAARHFNLQMSIHWKPKKHKALSISAKDVFDRYFRREPPFDKVDSKEFPDAFVVTALDQWCTREHQKMYVVTKDKAMLRAVANTETLIPLSTLEEFLALRVENPAIVERVESVLESAAWDTIEEAVRAGVSDLGTIYSGSLHDGEIIDHDALEDVMDLTDFTVISAADHEVEVILKVRVPIRFEVQYLDTTMAWYDSEDEEWVGGERETETFEQDVAINLLVRIDLENETVDDVALLTRDVHLEEPVETYK